jgi:hypothetical protein
MAEIPTLIEFRKKPYDSALVSLLLLCTRRPSFDDS